MPVYPGTNQPCFLPAAGISVDGYTETRLGFDSHTGTHMDAPAHMLPEGKSLDRYPISKFTGEAVVLSPEDTISRIDLPFLLKHKAKIAGADFVLFRTGWSRYWGEETYFHNFPVLDEEAALWLVTFPLKGIGIDAISVDPVESNTWPVHRLLFEADLIIIENLLFPADFNWQDGILYCFPLHYSNADGAPARVVMEKARPGK